ncbi:flagellar brake protein [Thiohalophilus sp.]|uniref:flagellar brake protein n=1 Tax=Thiohalophilus sp. TaxID=3028392 RepID=UPI002ACDD3BC|nr:flagellar brake protein [Thiohalophilus sp.]MDZ7804630.1 flagellar brake protein [Thiohalophilus sp.]
MTNHQDKPGAPEQEQRDNIENVDQYLLYSKAGIVQKLRQLSKSKNMITAHFNQGKYSLLTLIVDILPEKNLLVLDYGSDEKVTRKLLEAERAVFKTSYEGITAQFNATGFQRAKRHGKPAIACQLPDTLLWVQRREFYRIRLPMSSTVTCELINQDEENVQLPSLDLSVGGLALHHTDQPIAFEEGQIYENCTLAIPDTQPVAVNLEIRNIIPIGTMENGGYRIGAQFLNPGMDTSSLIQRYIQTVETQITRN